MRTFIILSVVVVARIHAEFVSPFPMKYDQVVDACRNETGYTDEMVAKEKASFFAENRGLRIFNYCFLEKAGFFTRHGKFNIEDPLTALTPNFLKDLVEHCNNRQNTYPESVFSTCFHTGVSNDIRFSEINNFIRAKNLTQIVETCRMETGYTDEVIAEEEEKSDLNELAGLKKFNSCFLEKTGFKSYEQFKIDDYLAEIPQSNAREIIESCRTKFIEKIIPNSEPFLSSCLHLGVSEYIRSTGVMHSVPAGESVHVTGIVKDCRAETGFTDEVLMDGNEEGVNFSEQKGLRKFNDCFLEKTGVITSDGKLNIDVALAKLPPSFAKPIIEHCQANIFLTYTTDSVHDFSTCYHHGVQSEIKSIFGFTNFWKLDVPGTSFVKDVFIASFYDDDFD